MKTIADEPIIPNENWGNTGSIGLTKLEYFSAMAMQGYCAHQDIGNGDMDKIARYSVMTAHALINHLNLEKE